MKKISFWAKRNKTASRSTLLLIHLVLISLAIFAGRQMVGSNHSTWVFIPFMITFLFALLLYPDKKCSRTAANRRKIYAVQKSCDFVLSFSSFFLMASFVAAFLSNKNTLRFPEAMASQPSSARTVNENPTVLPTEKEKKGSFHVLTHAERKALRHELKKEIKQLLSTSSKGSHESAGDVIGKIFLIILTLVAAAGLSYLVACIACSLSCSGAEGLAVLVAVFGLGAAITLSIITIKAIVQMGRKKKLEQTQPTTEANSE